MRRISWVVIGLAVAGFVGFVWGLTRTTTTPAGAGAVQARFVGEVGTAPGEPGIYRYRTTGFESIDALQGARHDYPVETFMTITAGPCGLIVRWDALDERWIEWSHCGPDVAIDATTSYHEWFGIPDLEEEICPEPRPIVGLREATTRSECVAGDDVESYTIEVVGSDLVDVDGEMLLTTHVRQTSELGGASSGIAFIDTWRLSETPLVVRMNIERRSVSPSAAGDVTYVEVVLLELIDPLPRGE